MKPARQNPLRGMLAVGDLRSDGLAAEAAALVHSRLDLLPDLVDLLTDPEPSTRGHAADALERVSREKPAAVEKYLGRLLSLIGRDSVAMVRWHLAMILANITRSAKTAGRCVPRLISLLDDPSAFVRAWSVSGLCLIGRQFSGFQEDILPALQRLRTIEASPSATAPRRRSRCCSIRTGPSPGAG
jgi:HEAT repeat protein